RAEARARRHRARRRHDHASRRVRLRDRLRQAPRPRRRHAHAREHQGGAARRGPAEAQWINEFHFAPGAVPIAPTSARGSGGTSLAASPCMETIRRAIARPLDPRTALLCIAILALNLLDAFATLRHLEYGAQELNPFMQALLHRGAG